MAQVQVFQLNAHLAGAVRLEQFNGQDGPVSRATFIAISNHRRGRAAGQDSEREDEATAIQWTLWGRQADNAAAYLCKGSHVNLVGHLRNNNYPAADGGTVYALAFTVDEIDYLDSRAEGDARRERHAFVDEIEAHEADHPSTGTTRRPSRKAAA